VSPLPTALAPASVLPAAAPALARPGTTASPWRYLVAFAAAAAATGLILAMIHGFLTTHAEATALGQTENIVTIAEGRLDGTLRRMHASLEATARILVETDFQEPPAPARARTMTDALRLQRSRFPEAAMFSVVRGDGRQVYTSADGPLLNLADRQWFKRTLENPADALIFSEVFTGTYSNVPVLVMAKPVRTQGGQFVGAITASLDLSHFQTLFASLDLGHNGIIAVRRTDDARLVARHPPLPDQLNKVVSSRLTGFYLNGEERGTARFTSEVDGVERLWAFRRVEGYPFVVVAGRAPDDYLEQSRRVMIVSGMVAALLLCMFGIYLRITWREERRVRLRGAIVREREARFRAVLETMEEGVVLADARDGRISLCNAAATRALGVPAARIIGSRLADLLGDVRSGDGTPLPRDRLPSDRCLAAHERVRDVVRFHRPGEAERWLRISSTPLQLGDDEGAAVLSTCFDVTTERLMSEALKRSEARFQGVVSSAMDGILAADEHGRIILINPAAEKMFKAGAGVALGASLQDLLPGLVLADVRGEPASHEAPCVWRGEARRPDGSTFPVEASLAKHQVVEGEWVIVVRDVTDRVKAEQALFELNVSLDERVRARTLQLERANGDLEAFSYSVSHDLRAPLRAIGTYSALLVTESGSVSEEAQRLSQRLRANVARMDELINDVLAYSRASRSEMRESEIDLDALATSVVEDLRQNYPRTLFEVERLGKAWGDPAMVRQVLCNLLENACKYSDMRSAPCVRLSAHVRADGRPEYRVSDNGIGFDMVYAGKLFGMFNRLHADASIPGTGVGLALVKRLVERSRGEVGIVHASEAGASFYFTLGMPPGAPAL
jgi:PAS domain S-box-containing protein